MIAQFLDSRLPQNFWDRVVPEPNSGCWLWIGAHVPEGYGRFGEPGRSSRKKHITSRYAYEVLVGPVPAGLELDHLCRVPPCCNPDHLEPVTHRENMRRSNAPPGINARKTLCPRGHEYSGARASGARYCAVCSRESQRNQMQRTRTPERVTVRLSAFGDVLSVYEWSIRTGLSVGTIRDRIRAEWAPERIVTQPPRPERGRRKRAA